MTHYIVTGHQRSGSSAMMRCLEMGGMDVAVNREQEKILSDRVMDRKYNPNPYGFYELDESEYNTYPTVWSRYDGMVVKLLFEKQLFVPGTGGLKKVVCMYRHPKELKRSWLESYGKSYSEESFEEMYDRNVSIIRARRDMDMLIVDYPAFTRAPEGILKLMQSKGWPIEVEKAAKGMDPSLYRNLK